MLKISLLFFSLIAWGKSVNFSFILVYKKIHGNKFFDVIQVQCI